MRSHRMVGLSRPGFRTLTAGLLVIAAGLLPVCPAGAITPEEAAAIGVEAYVFGYPLVTMDMTRRVMTNVALPEGMRAPMGQFVRMRTYPYASNPGVTAPNADTLYTAAWLDVSKEPWVLSVPDTPGRYCLFPMLDGWTEVFQVPGKRTTGTKAQKYAITGPGWKGTLPQASGNTSRPPAWSGSWAASTAPARRRITRRCTRCRTSSRWLR